LPSSLPIARLLAKLVSTQRNKGHKGSFGMAEG
jgi:hypothetical protein